MIVPQIKYLIFSMLALILVSGAISSVHAKSGGSTQGKWTQHTDPYGRYTIEYPSKWGIEADAVHTNENYLYEVPLKKSSGHGWILIVRDMDTTNGLTLKEYASYYLENVNQDIGSRIMNPVSCGYMSAQPVESCHYGLVTTVGNSAIATLVQLYTGSDKKVFVVTLMVSESSASKNIVNHILDSFRIVGEPINIYPRDAAQNTHGDFIPSCSGDYYHPC